MEGTSVISDDVRDFLAQLVEDNRATLKKLTLDSCNIKNRHDLVFLISLLNKHKIKLEYLNLSNNPIDFISQQKKKDILYEKYLGNALKNIPANKYESITDLVAPELKTLILENCEMNSLSLACILRAPSFSSLKKLTITGPNMIDVGTLIKIFKNDCLKISIKNLSELKIRRVHPKKIEQESIRRYLDKDKCFFEPDVIDDLIKKTKDFLIDDINDKAQTIRFNPKKKDDEKSLLSKIILALLINRIFDVNQISGFYFKLFFGKAQKHSQCYLSPNFGSYYCTHFGLSKI